MERANKVEKNVETRFESVDWFTTIFVIKAILAIWWIFTLFHAGLTNETHFFMDSIFLYNWIRKSTIKLKKFM